jgi:gluconate 2-dehydrogenase gamma chain
MAKEKQPETVAGNPDQLTLLLDKARSVGMPRRKFLALLGGSGATALLAACAPASAPTLTPAATASPSTATSALPVASPSPTLKPVVEVYLFFNQTEAATMKAVFGRLLPGSPQDPGAVEAGAHIYIDHALAGPYSAQQTSYRRGIAAINAYSLSKNGKNFADLAPDQQDAVLTEMQNERATGFYAPGPAAFFRTLLQHTREGTFCDPVYGGNQNLVGWKMIGFPGAQLAYGDDDMKPGADQAKKNILTLADTEGIPMPSPQSGF